MGKSDKDEDAYPEGGGENLLPAAGAAKGALVSASGASVGATKAVGKAADLALVAWKEATKISPGEGTTLALRDAEVAVQAIKAAVAETSKVGAARKALQQAVASGAAAAARFSGDSRAEAGEVRAAAAATQAVMLAAIRVWPR